MAQQTGEQGIPSKTSNDAGLSSPLDLEARDWKATLRHTAREVMADRITMAAAGMAFYFFLAIFPSLIAAVGLLNLLNVGPDVLSSITESISSTMPGSTGSLLTDAVSNAQAASERASLVAAIVGVSVALWSATSGMVAMQIGLDIAYDVPQERTFVKKRLVALGLIGSLGVMAAVATPLLGAEGLVWSVLGWVVAAAAVVVLLAIFYYLGPNREKPSWKWLSPGGLFGGAVWILVSVGFGIYVTEFGKYGDTYGELATVIVLIFWLYLIALAILVGGELNAAVERQAAIKEGLL